MIQAVFATGKTLFSVVIEKKLKLWQIAYAEIK